MKILEFIKGKKTYILAAAGAITVGLWWAGVIDADLADKILAVLGFGSIAALRAAK